MRCGSGTDHLAAGGRHRGQGVRAVDRRVAVVDRHVDDPGPPGRRRAGLFRVARIGVVHLDVDRGAARPRILAVLHPRRVRCDHRVVARPPGVGEDHRRRRRPARAVPARPRGRRAGSIAGTPPCWSRAARSSASACIPIDDPSPLMSLLVGDGEGGLALALRSSTRAIPVLLLGLGLERRGAGVGVPGVHVPPSGRIAHRSHRDRARCGGRDLRRRQPPGRCATVDSSTRSSSATRIRPRPGSTPPPTSTNLTGPGGTGCCSSRGASSERSAGGTPWTSHCPDSPSGRCSPAICCRSGARRRWISCSPSTTGSRTAWSTSRRSRRSPACSASTRIWVADDVAFDRFRARPPGDRRRSPDRRGGPRRRSAAGGALRGADGDGARRRGRRRTVGRATRGSASRSSTVALVGVSDPVPTVRVKDTSVVVSGSADGLVDAAAAGVIDGIRAHPLQRHRSRVTELTDMLEPVASASSSPTRTGTALITGAARRTSPATPRPVAPSPACCATRAATSACRCSTPPTRRPRRCRCRTDRSRRRRARTASRSPICRNTARSWRSTATSPPAGSSPTARRRSTSSSRSRSASPSTTSRCVNPKPPTACAASLSVESPCRRRWGRRRRSDRRRTRRAVPRRRWATHRHRPDRRRRAPSS